MMSSTTVALTLFVVWALLLQVLMGAIRTKLVLTREVPPDGFSPANVNLCSWG